MILKKIKNKIEKKIARIKFRQKNKHNAMHVKFFGGAKPDIDKISVGNFSYGLINAYQFGCNDSNLVIGHLCSIAEDVIFILGGEHNSNLFTTYPCNSKIYKDKSDTMSKGDIIVENDVWIGYGATILSGVKIGNGAIIASKAVVTKDVEPYAIYGGVPARKIGIRFSEEIVDELMKIQWENVNEEKLNSLKDMYNQQVTIKNVKEIVKRLNS